MTEIRWEAEVLSIRQSLFSRVNSLVASTSIRFSVDRRPLHPPFERFPRCNRSNHRNSPAFDEFSSSFARKCSYVNSFVTDRVPAAAFSGFSFDPVSTGTHAHTQTHTNVRTTCTKRSFWILNKELRVLFGRTDRFVEYFCSCNNAYDFEQFHAWLFCSSLFSISFFLFSPSFF